MQCAASALVAGQLGSARLPAARGRRCGQQRSRAARVVGRYAAGAGAAPPPPAQAAPLPPAEPQAPAQRPPLPARRRVGVNVAPVTPPAPAGSGALRQLTAAAGQMAGSVAGGGGAAPQEPFTTNVQRAAAYTTAAEVLLSRSQVVDKEVITRTSGKRLGYVTQMFVDPASLAVVSLYLRRSASSLGVKKGEEHILWTSVRQISDVILVHNEDVLLDPIADESVGYCSMVGVEVVQQDGKELGKVRDFIFDPDSGGVVSIKYDSLGIPSLPQSLFDCYSISFDEVLALGPTRMVVRTGTYQRAIKENEGLLQNTVALLAGSIFGGGSAGEEKRLAAAQGDSSYRQDPAYVQWYEQWGRSSGADPPGTPEYAAERQARQQASGRAAPAAPAAAPARQQAPPALPPPQTSTFAQAVQPQQAQQAASYQQAYQQQMFQPQRQAVPAGGGGWAAPPPPAATAAAYQQPYPAAQQQQQQYQQPPPAPAPAAPQQPQTQQQYRAPPAAPQQPRPAAAGPPPQTAQQAQQAQRPPIPQNGIPIIDRTPLPPYRRRDADGNYGSPPAQQAAAAPRQPPPAAAAGWGSTAQAPRAAQQPARMQQQAPVVVPDAVIPGGVQRPTDSAGSGGAVGGLTQPAEYRQL